MLKKVCRTIDPLNLFVSISLAALGCATAKLETTHWFPDNPTLEFIPGKSSSCVIGLRNTGSTTANVSMTTGHLAFAQDPSLILMNFTYGYHHNKPVPAGGEATVEYDLFFHPRLPPREFLLTIKAFVSAEEGSFNTLVVFNNTIDVVEPYRLIDTELLFLYVIFAGLLALVGWGIMEFAKSKGWVKKAKKARTKVTGPSDKEDWLKGTFAYQHEAKKASKQS